MVSTELVIETSIITFARLGLFYFCRTYLLRSLYHDLRVLSSQSLSQNATLTPSPSSAAIPAEPLSPASPYTAQDTSSYVMLSTMRSHSPAPSDTDISDIGSGLPSPSMTPRKRTTSGFTWPPKLRSVLPNPAKSHAETNIQSSLARSTFALCFSESCVLFLMVMFQGAKIFRPRTRKFNWDVSLTVLICLILLLIPLFQCAFVTQRSFGTSESTSIKRWLLRRGLIIAFPYCLFLFAVFRIPLPEGLAATGLVSASLSRLTVIGVFILGLISGYGCISTAAMFFVNIAGSDWVEPSQQEVIQAEQSLFRVRSDLLERQKELDKRVSLPDPSSPSSANTGWFGRLSSALRGGDSELTGLQREIQGLEILEREMARDLKELQVRKARIAFSRTWKGKLWKWIGWLFGLYCAFRILSSLLNLIYPHRPPYHHSSPGSSASHTPDLIALLLSYLLSRIPLPPSLSFLQLATPAQIAALSRQLSLVLIGCIVMVSVRGVLAGVGRVLRMISRDARNTSVGVTATTGPHQPPHSNTSRRSLIANIMLLVLAQVMGLYLLSTLIQLRNSFPPDDPEPGVKTNAELSLLSTLPSYEVFNSLFDWSFVLSASATAGGRWLRRKIRG